MEAVRAGARDFIVKPAEAGARPRGGAPGRWPDRAARARAERSERASTTARVARRRRGLTGGPRGASLYRAPVDARWAGPGAGRRASLGEQGSAAGRRRRSSRSWRVLAIVGGAIGVGPLAATTPPDQVTDPVEMVARSLQAVLDANAVHLDATVDGTLPGRGRGPAGAQRRPRRDDGDARHPAPGRTTRAPVDSAALGVAPRHGHGVGRRSGTGRRRTHPGRRRRWAAHRPTPGLDVNPLTLVDRLRS